MEMAMFIFALIGVVLVLTLIVAIGAYYYGKIKEKNQVAEANLDAAKKAKETHEVIHSLPSAELRNRAAKWVRKDK